MQAAPLSRARVTIRLRDGRVFAESADGARGYPGRVTDEELAEKFAGCASRTMSPAASDRAWTTLMEMERVTDARKLTALFESPA